MSTFETIKARSIYNCKPSMKADRMKRAGKVTKATLSDNEVVQAYTKAHLNDLDLMDNLKNLTIEEMAADLNEELVTAETEASEPVETEVEEVGTMTELTFSKHADTTKKNRVQITYTFTNHVEVRRGRRGRTAISLVKKITRTGVVVDRRVVGKYARLR